MLFQDVDCLWMWVQLQTIWKDFHNENVESEDRKYLNAKYLAILFYNVKAKQTFPNNEIHLFLRYRKSLSYYEN